MNRLLYLIIPFLFFSCSRFEVSENTNDFFHVSIDKTEIPVWVKGNTVSNKLVIYINGGPGLTSIDVAKADMFGWSKKLEKNHAMVYYDQRGCGNAAGNIDKSTLTIEQYVKDLDAVITVLRQEYNNPEIYLMGHSFGSFIGVNYLLTDNLENNISGWISIDGAYNFDYDLSWKYRREFLINIATEEIENENNINHWQDALDWAEENNEITTKVQKNEWSDYIGQPGGIIIPEELPTLSLKQYLEIGFTSSYNSLPAYFSPNLEIVNDALNLDAEGKNYIENVTNLNLPSLFIWGKYDDLIAPEEGRDVFNNLGTPDDLKEFILFEKSSHEPYISDPEKFENSILKFVNQ